MFDFDCSKKHINISTKTHNENAYTILISVSLFSDIEIMIRANDEWIDIVDLWFYQISLVYDRINFGKQNSKNKPKI